MEGLGSLLLRGSPRHGRELLSESRVGWEGGSRTLVRWQEKVVGEKPTGRLWRRFNSEYCNRESVH